MWELYDELISAVPPELTVAECLIGLHWTLVRSKSVGMAMTPIEGHTRINSAGRIAGKPVREVAQWIKSWSPLEATVGLAALNSVFNTPDQLERLSGRTTSLQEDENPFSSLRSQLRGKRVAVVGHFSNLERLAESCHLSVLERNPQPGDYPDPACEELLPQQDFVFITGTTLANKTLPRLLELSRQAIVVVVGPSTPLAPTLFRHGIDVLAGAVVVEPEPLWQVVQEGGWKELFRNGARRVMLSSEAVLPGRSNVSAWLSATVARRS